jgi:hypothetical protein
MYLEVDEYALAGVKVYLKNRGTGVLSRKKRKLCALLSDSRKVLSMYLEVTKYAQCAPLVLFHLGFRNAPQRSFCSFVKILGVLSGR